MAVACRDLVTGDRCEELVQLQLLLIRTVVEVVVVVGRDGELDALACDRHDALESARVSVAGELEGVDVRVAGDEARRVDLVVEGEGQRCWRVDDAQGGLCDAPLGAV